MTEQREEAMEFQVEAEGPGVNKKLCHACGAAILQLAEICPKCGVRQKGAINKVALVLITFFLGGIGGHKFYLRKYGQGVLYLLFCWTGIPSLIAFVEFLIYAFTDEQTLAERYQTATSGAAVAVAIAAGFGLIIVMGILAAIAIPQFAAYRTKAFNAAAQSDLQVLKSCFDGYFAEKKRYPVTIAEVATACGESVLTVQSQLFVIPAGDQNYQMVTFHAQGDTAFIASGENAQIGSSAKAAIQDQIEAEYQIIEQKGKLAFVE